MHLGEFRCRAISMQDAPLPRSQVHPEYPVEGYVMTRTELQLHNFPVPLRDGAGTEHLPPGFVSTEAPGVPRR